MHATGKVRPALADLETDFFLLAPRPPFMTSLVVGRSARQLELKRGGLTRPAAAGAARRKSAPPSTKQKSA